MVRNAFAIRTSEQSATDDAFARYFSPEVLTVLPKDLFTASALVLRSSPGGGKTSVLRIFTPGPLLQVHRNQSIAPYNDTFNHLSDLGALDQSHVRVMGLLIPCTAAYSEIGPPLPAAKARGLFRALINARIILRALRAVCALHDLEYPIGLEHVDITFDPSLFDEGPVPRTTNALDLRVWAETEEMKSLAPLDVITGGSETEAPSHAAFDAIVWLSQASFAIRGQGIGVRPIVMLDDVHRLRPGQRKLLFEELLNHRSGTPVWLAERTEILSSYDLLSGPTPRRDFEEIQLEQAWLISKGKKRYLKFVTAIADRRVMQMSNELQSFGDHLANSMSGSCIDTRLGQVVETLKDRILATVSALNRYDDWLRALQKLTSASRLEEAISWAKLEILITRDLNKRQRSLNFEPLSDQELEARETSGVSQAAEKFVCSEFGLPYFFGTERIVRLSSYNIEEFLQICEVLYEHIHAARVMGGAGPIIVSAVDQHRALRELAKRRFEEIPRAFPFGSKAQRLIWGIGQMSHERTFEPNAPYAPGVTGIGLTVQDRQTLIEAANKGPDHPFAELASVLSGCVAQNLFEVRDSLRQDNKNWTVLYLNRMLCVQFDLVYHTGGWQHVSIRQLLDWCEGNYPQSGKRLALA